MVAPKWFHPFEWGIPGMNGIMHTAIDQIAQQKARKEHKAVGAHNQVHNAHNDTGKNQARNRGHKQALFIPGEMMVIAMEGIGEFFTPTRIRNPMENKAVGNVFKKRPEKYTSQKG